MQTFPMFLVMRGRDAVIVGGGEQAAQKARLVTRTEAKLTIWAQDLDDELAALVAKGAARQVREVAEVPFGSAALTFIATGCPGMDSALRDLAKARGAAVVNVVDRPELCDALTPSIVDRDPVVVAIGTEGTAPVLGRSIRARIETLLEPRLGDLAALAGRLRDSVAAKVPQPERRAFWDWVFSGRPREEAARGNLREAARVMKEAIAAGGPGETPGRITLVGAGPGAADLLTLRALTRLQVADVIFYDRLVDPGVLDLARRDAERVFVGKTVGGRDWPQDRINGLIVAAARQGQNVVRLKSGDPGIFGRATEELEAARAAGIEVEIVPGVTAASGAAASLGRSLTERGATDHLVLATGMNRDGDALPDWAAHLRPGTALALYMGVRSAALISESLMAAGAPFDLPAEVVSEATTARERRLTATLGTLAGALAEADMPHPAILFLRWPKDHVGAIARAQTR